MLRRWMAPLAAFCTGLLILAAATPWFLRKAPTLSLSAPYVQSADRWLIRPNLGARGITATTTPGELEAMFPGKLRMGALPGPEGVDEPVTLVQGEQIAVHWAEMSEDDRAPMPKSHVALIDLCADLARGEPCRWHTEQGLTVGLDVSQVESLNGAPFTLSGYNAVEGTEGRVLDWRAGRLGVADVCQSLLVTMDGGQPEATLTAAQMKLVSELRPVSYLSSSYSIRLRHPTVSLIQLRFVDPASCPYSVPEEAQHPIP